MAHVYLFADEAGDFSFNARGSRFFVIGSVTMASCAIGNELLSLRRELTLQGRVDQRFTEFHAAEDRQEIRDRVFRLLGAHDFRIDATILDKTKTLPRLAEDPLRFYKQAWYLHFQYVGPRVAGPKDDLLVVASALQVSRKKAVLGHAVRDVVEQIVEARSYRTAFWPAQSDPCLQVADYVTWAIQRKHERGDTRSYELIRDRLESEFQPFRVGTTTYY
ncbi:MAG TPA: DUF3800 domain-containing protein [Actinomycetes bacterium]|nr:DUF3800 domain-containing protein [Actinomycetes bacterium]